MRSIRTVAIAVTLAFMANTVYPIGSLAKQAKSTGSAEMQQFRRRIDEAVQDRFHLLAKIRLERGSHLTGTVRFSISNARIARITWIRKTNSESFNELAIQSVKSLEGDAALLAQPSGNKPVEITVTFEFPRPDCRY